MITIHLWFINSLRLILRLHSVLHCAEAYAAFAEQAWITFSIVCITGTTQILASFFLPHEHIHLRSKFLDIVHKHKEKDNGKTG